MAAPPIAWFIFCMLSNVGTLAAFGLTFWFEEKKIYVKDHPNTDQMHALHNKARRTILVTGTLFGLTIALGILCLLHRQLARNIQNRMWRVPYKFVAICNPGIMTLLVIRREQHYQSISAALAVAFISQLKFHVLMQPDAGEMLKIIGFVTAQHLSGIFVAVSEKRYVQAYLLAVPVGVGIIALMENINAFGRDVLTAFQAINQAYFRPPVQQPGPEQVQEPAPEHA